MEPNYLQEAKEFYEKAKGQLGNAGPVVLLEAAGIALDLHNVQVNAQLLDLQAAAVQHVADAGVEQRRAVDVLEEEAARHGGPARVRVREPLKCGPDCPNMDPNKHPVHDDEGQQQAAREFECSACSIGFYGPDQAVAHLKLWPHELDGEALTLAVGKARMMGTRLS